MLSTVRLHKYLQNNIIYLILVQPNSLLLSSIYSYSVLGEMHLRFSKPELYFEIG